MLDEREHYAETLHASLRVIPYNIDIKVSVVLAATIGMLAFVLKLCFGDDGQSQSFLLSAAPVKVASLYSSLVIFTASSLSSLMALWARTDGDLSGLFSFTAISRRASADAFVDEVLSRSDEELLRDEIRHCYELAKIVDKKVHWFHRAILLVVAGILAAAVGMWL